MNTPDLPRIAVGGLGGTIAMKPAQSGEGASPGLTAEDLVAAVPELASLARIETRSLANVASPSLTCNNLLETLAWADGAVRDGVRGVVVTHGTDTLEESSFLLDLLWPHEAPLVFTGAMRSARMAGAEGPANLLAAVQVANSAEARGMGVLACLNDTVHIASRVTKTASMALETFAAPGYGPLGQVVEGVFRRDWLPAAARLAPLAPPPPGPILAAMLEAPFDDDGRLIELVHGAGYRGLVIAGAGVGHASVPATEAITRAIADGVVVVVASRTLRGGTARRLYGYPGSESDLISRGAIMAGTLSARKARLLLHVLLGNGASREAIAAEFAARGQG